MVFRPLTSRFANQQFRREMDRLLSDFFGNHGEGASTGPATARPAVSAWETAEAVAVELEVPGIKSDQVDISVVGNELTITVQRPDTPQQGVTYHRRERAAGRFSRVLRLPVEVDANRVEAELRNGVLTITLPKAAAAQARRIQVTTS